MEKTDCIFCTISLGTEKKVYDDKNFFGILDIHPKADGHTLVISKKHFTSLLDLPSSLGGELLDAIKHISEDLIKKKKGEGVNIIVNLGESAGQKVGHVHVHIIPRNAGDGLRSLA